MITEAVIQEVISKLVKAYDPLEIYLFGSYAWGNPTEDSDLDILVIIERSDESSYQRMLVGHRALMDVGIAKDILVQTREEFERKSDDITTLYYKIKREGKRVYVKTS